MVTDDISDTVAAMEAENEEPAKIVVGTKVYEEIRKESGRAILFKYMGMVVQKSGKLKPDDWFIVPKGQTLGLD